MKTELKMMLVAAMCVAQFVMADEAKGGAESLVPGNMAVNAYVGGAAAADGMAAESSKNCKPRRGRRAKDASSENGVSAKTATKKRRSRKSTTEKVVPAPAVESVMECMR